MSDRSYMQMNIKRYDKHPKCLLFFLQYFKINICSWAAKWRREESLMAESVSHTNSNMQYMVNVLLKCIHEIFLTWEIWIQFVIIYLSSSTIQWPSKLLNCAVSLSWSAHRSTWSNRRWNTSRMYIGDWEPWRHSWLNNITQVIPE